MNFVTTLKELADSGSGIACFEYAQRLFRGTETEQNTSEAWRYLQKGIQLNHAICSFNAFQEAIGGNFPIEAMPIEAWSWLKKAAVLGHSAARVEYAKYLLRKNQANIVEAFEFLFPEIQRGNPHAYFVREAALALDGVLSSNAAVNVANLNRKCRLNDEHAKFAMALNYQFGLLSSPNAMLALDHMSQAKNIVGSGYFLNCLSRGQEIPKGTSDFMALLFRDAENGDCAAAAKVFKVLQEEGVPESIPQHVRKHIACAALNGSHEAIELIGYEVDLETWGEELRMNKEEWQTHAAKWGGVETAKAIYTAIENGDNSSLVFEHFKNTLDSGSLEAYRYFGLHLLTCKEKRMAIPWLYLAHTEGDLWSTHMLGKFLYEEGQTHSEKMAGFQMIKECADLDHSWAAYEMAVIFEKGFVGPINLSASNKYFRQAAENGSTAAAQELALKFRYGVGVEKNDSLADYWNLKALNSGYLPTSGEDDVPRIYLSKEASVITLEEFRSLKKSS